MKNSAIQTEKDPLIELGTNISNLRLDERTSNISRKENLNQYDVSWLKGTAADQSVTNRRYVNKSAPNIRGDFSDPVYKKLSKINGKINSMSINELVHNLRILNLETTGKKEVLMRRLKNHHKELHLNKEVISDYDYVCVIDYEATCTETSNFNYPHEIIEFPIVLVNMRTLNIEAHFQSYCKPKINPKLTKFCTSLTGINQNQVDTADEFPVVLNQVNEWFLSHGLGETYTFTVAADGPWDMQKFLNMQCEHSNIEYPYWAKGWIDVRKMFSNWFGTRRCGIVRMLDYIGLEFEGNQHCGLDDSRNVARILLRLANDGCRIKNNSRLKENFSYSEPNYSQQKNSS